jgi:hypothetical protein
MPTTRPDGLGSSPWSWKTSGAEASADEASFAFALALESRDAIGTMHKREPGYEQESKREVLDASVPVADLALVDCTMSFEGTFHSSLGSTSITTVSPLIARFVYSLPCWREEGMRD